MPKLGAMVLLSVNTPTGAEFTREVNPPTKLYFGKVR